MDEISRLFCNIVGDKEERFITLTPEGEVRRGPEERDQEAAATSRSGTPFIKLFGDVFV